MTLTNFFTMPYTKEYSIREEYILALIEMNSDSKVSHITRGKLCELSGVRSVDVITKYTNKFQADGLLKKVDRHIKGRNLVEYHLTPSREYIIIYNSLLQFGECTGLAIKMAKLRLKGTSEIRMSNNSIIKKLGLTKPTFLKYRNMLLENGILIDTENGYALNTDYFPIINKQTTPTAKQKKKIDEILNRTEKVEDSSIRVKKILLSYYDPKTNTFSGLKGSVDDFLDFCLSGVPKKSKNPVEQPNIQYQF